VASPWIVERVDEHTLRIGNLASRPRHHVAVTLIAPNRVIATYHLSTVDPMATVEILAVGDYREAVVSWGTRWRRRRWRGPVPQP